MLGAGRYDELVTSKQMRHGRGTHVDYFWITSYVRNAIFVTSQRTQSSLAAAPVHAGIATLENLLAHVG